MSTYYIPGGEVAILPATPMKDGKGTFPASLMIATRRGRIFLAPETVTGLIAAIHEHPDLFEFVRPKNL